MNYFLIEIFVIVLIIIQTINAHIKNTCSQHDALTLIFSRTMCHPFVFTHILRNPIYILYDVNPSEGFNLRRDVYIRMAVLIKHLQRSHTFHDVRLVVPPFQRLYHWKSRYIDQDNVPWTHFFDLNSMNNFISVLDFDEFLEEMNISGSKNNIKLDYVYQLKNFQEMFENGVFRDKLEIENCNENEYNFNIFGLEHTNFKCLKFQGSANLLEKVLRISLNRLTKSSSTSIYPVKMFFLSAEIVLHDHWGSVEFWRARRSMRFNKDLTRIADNFRVQFLNSTNESGMVQRPFNWVNEQPYRGARGGDYLCVHLRRGDFVRGREQTTPTLKSAASQIKSKLKELNLKTVFVSSDCTQFEFKNLKSHLQRLRVVRFSPESLDQKFAIKDGGIAIIDQIICSHARYFIGTHESTFTFRVYEEREILGFSKITTFNALCKDDLNCSNVSIWPIQY